jgi:hypothetical protein
MDEVDIFKMLNGDMDPIDIQDELQDEICNYCQSNIINGPSMSYHFMCEGAYCEDAFEGFEDNINKAVFYRRIDICQMILDNQTITSQ